MKPIISYVKQHLLIFGISILFAVVAIVTLLWFRGTILISWGPNIIALTWITLFIGLCAVINRVFLDEPLVIEDTLLQYPWYKLVLASVGIIAAMVFIDAPVDRLIGSFAIASIVLGRDHRWAAFGALTMLGTTIVSLLIEQQIFADTYAIYLYYFLVIATVTMLINNRGEETNQDTETLA